MEEKTCLNELTDEELVLRSQQGDENSKDILYHRYKNFVRAKTRPYFLIGADREDILQEGMIGLFKAIRDYSPAFSTCFRDFASMCINRHVLTAIKMASSSKHIPLNSYVSLYTPVSDGDADVRLIDTLEGYGSVSPEDMAENSETMESFIENAKKRLTGLEYRVMELFLSGMSYKEIAEELGQGTKTIDNALQRIRKKFSHT